MDEKVCSQLVELNCLYKEIEDIFHNLARHYELSDSALWILYFMRESHKTYTQKEISEILSSSKQTVHSALKTLEAAGYIKLEFTADNRKNKRITLTSSGEAFAEKSVDSILLADRTALDKLDAAERNEFLRLYHKYVGLLRDETNQLMQTSYEDSKRRE